MASTYVNDLRLNEMATGDQSGSWGTVTNLNLELIGEAFSYGTEAITTNANTHTTTIADGATDAGRSMFLKYTGTLDSACTITIGPNTVSKVWFIENSTSGSQNIIISQGSGANVTIAAGQTKAVYSDGAGSGAAFVDAFSSLNVAGVSPTELAVLDGITTLGTVQASKAVTADAAGDVKWPDNDKAVFGAGSDLQIYHDGDDSYIADVGTGDLKIQGGANIIFEKTGGEDMLTMANDGSVVIKYNGIDRIETTTAGVDVTGTVTMDGGSTSADFTFGDNDKAIFGAGSDLQIYHTGGNSNIADLGTGNLVLQTNGNSVKLQKGTTETLAEFKTDGAVDLYHNNNLKLATNSGGITVTGTINGGDLRGEAWTIGRDSNDYFSVGSTSQKWYLDGAEDMRLENDGDLHVEGNVIAYSTTISDERLKTDIVKIDGALDKVAQLNGYTFTYTADGKKSAGVIAQEVQKVLPSAIIESKLPLKMGDDDETEYMTVQYDQLMGLMVEAIKELKAEVAELKGK